MPVLYACGCTSDGEFLKTICEAHHGATKVDEVFVKPTAREEYLKARKALLSGEKVRILISGNNQNMWPYAYRDDKEAEFYREWLDKKFVLNSPFYILELEVE